MENGAVWLHRAADSNEVLRHPIRFSLFLRCVMRACWKDRQVVYRGKQISLARGQLAWSIRDMAEGVGCSVKEIRTAIKHLKMATMLDIDEGTVPQLVTVLNYNDYQSWIENKGTEEGTVRGTVGAQQGHSRGTQNNKDKKDNKDNNKDSADLIGEPPHEKSPYPSKSTMNKSKGRKPYPEDFENLWSTAFKRDEDKSAKLDIYGHWLDGVLAGHQPDDILTAAKAWKPYLASQDFPKGLRNWMKEASYTTEPPLTVKKYGISGKGFQASRPRDPDKAASFDRSQIFGDMA